MMLSPPVLISTAIGLRPGKAIVQPDVPEVAVSTYFVGVVSPVAGTDRMFHFPATSARLTGAGAVGAFAVVAAVEDAIVLLVSVAALFSFLAQPASTAAQHQSAMRVEWCSVNMKAPV